MSAYAMNVVEALEKKLDEATPLTHKAAGIPPEYAILPRESVRQLAQEFKALRALMLGRNDPAFLPGMFEIGKRLIALEAVATAAEGHGHPYNDLGSIGCPICKALAALRGK